MLCCLNQRKPYCDGILGRRKALQSKAEPPSVPVSQNDPHDIPALLTVDRNVAFQELAQGDVSWRQRLPITFDSPQSWLDFWDALEPLDLPYRTLVYWAELRAQRKREITSNLLSQHLSSIQHTHSLHQGSMHRFLSVQARNGVDNGDSLSLDQCISSFENPLSIDRQLFVSIQYNALRGALSNIILLLSLQGRPIRGFEDFDLDDVPAPPKTAPPALQATDLQRTTPHELWIDTIPYPVLRDNIIRNQDELDVDSLCDDFVGGMYNGLSEIGSRGLILWGEPWSDDGWEISEGFAKKWSFLLKGCDDLIESTNSWRENRAEERLVVEL
jgi:hypothetical protein